MDPAVLSLPDVMKEDYLTCRICYELYTLPKFLPCLHSYCLQCLQQLVKDGSLHCPECRMEVDVVEGVSSLKTNSFMIGLLELFKSKRVKNMQCAICSTSQRAFAATSRCLDCNDFLCQTCTQGHHCSRQSLDHKVVDLKEFLTGQHDAEVRLRQKVYCQVHQQEPLKFFCDTCSTPICRDCGLLDHFQHNVLSMQEAILKKKPEVKKLVEGLELKIAKISEHQVKVEKSLVMLRATADHITENIHSYVDKVTAQLLAQKEQALGQLDTFLKRETEQCLSLKETLQSQRKKAESIVAMSQKVIHVGKEIEIMNMEDLMREQIDELQIFNPQPIEMQVPELMLGWDQKDLPKMTHFTLVFNREKTTKDAVPVGSHATRATLHQRVASTARGSPAQRGASAARRADPHPGAYATRGGGPRGGPPHWGVASIMAAAHNRRVGLFGGSPASRGARALRGSPASRGARALRGSPASRGARALRGSPAPRGARARR